MSQRRAIPKRGFGNIQKQAKYLKSDKNKYFCMKKGRFRTSKAFRLGMLTLQTRLCYFCGACGMPVVPVV
jgi:hypothetical protein